MWCHVGFYNWKTKNDTLTLVPKSNLMNYDFYLPKNSKFTKGEYRLKKI